MRRTFVVPFIVLSCRLLLHDAHATEIPATEVLERIRLATLDPGRAVQVNNLELDMGLGALHLLSGHLVPAVPIAGHTVEFVFQGQARFRVEPPDAVESWQLELFTGQRSLDVGVTRAVFVVGNPELADRLFDRPAGTALDADGQARARDLFAAWVDGTERKGFGADRAILDALHGDEAYRDYFAALLEPADGDRFFYVLDPGQLEQVTLGQFVPLDLDDREAFLSERSIRRAQQQGRSIQTRLEDLGDWDTWLSASLRDDSGTVRPGSPGFESRHYTLDAAVDPKTLKIKGRATLDLVATDRGRRGLALTLFPDLTPSIVRDGRGSELPWFRSGGDLHVLLAEAPEHGQSVQVVVEYAGVLLDRVEPGIFRLRSTGSWYPRAGAIDRATYDVTLRRPKGLGLLAGGRLEEQREEAGQQIERRVLDVRAKSFSFEVGDFKVIEEQVGHVRLRVGFSKSSMAKDTDAEEHTLETLRGALAFYEQQYGAYPLDDLTVATVPRFFSQGFLSFLTLSQYVLALPRHAWVLADPVVGRDMQRLETVAHELAHQWWGNKVGWYNYRDQWLSEALASFSALRYAATQAPREAVYLTRRSWDWQRALARSANNGLTVESLGPVVLGQRLASSLSDEAYESVVYDKGSVVFSTLARLLGEEPLTGMLHSLADAVGNRAIDTDVFIRSLERMSGADLQEFASRYIYGTGVSDVYYRYAFERAAAGDGWVVRGEARQIAHGSNRYRLVRTPQATWDVERTNRIGGDVSDRSMIVPFQVVLEAAEDRESRQERRETGFATGRGLAGEIVLLGEVTPFEIPVPEEPISFWLDQRGEVLARFHSESRTPKRAMRYRAMELTGDDARTTLQQALASELVSETMQQEHDWSDGEVERLSRIEDAWIHLDLARLHLDDRQDAAAEEALATARNLAPREYASPRHRNLRNSLAAARSPAREEPASAEYRNLDNALRCRLALRRGNYKEVFEALEGELALRVPRTADAGIGEEILRERWSHGIVGNGEDYAMLAAAAHETGNSRIARLALQEAEQRNADVTELAGALESGPDALED